MKILLFLWIVLIQQIANSAENGNIAFIDVGLNMEDIVNNKLIYSKSDQCLYNYDIESNSNCLKYVHNENHANIVYRILQSNLMENSILSFQYASQDKSLKLLNNLKYPSSGKEVWLKKQVLKQQSIQIANAILKAVNYHATVINISLADRGFYTKELEVAIKNNPNVLFVFAAGNSGNDLSFNQNKTFPCSLKFNNTLCVGSLNSSNKVAEYSNHGSDVDLYVKPLYEEGTSFSSPRIANEAFLLLQKSNNIQFVINMLKTKYHHNSK